MLRLIQRSFTLLCIGLLGISPFSASAQEFPEPEDDTEPIVITGARRIAYVAPGTDGETTDIYTLELLDQAGIIDHDNDPTTPRVIEEASYQVTNLTNTPDANEIDPQFSWDGSLILFRGEADPTTYPGVNSLFVVNSDGQNNVQITPNGVNVFYGTFSPDGTQVAFMAQWGSSQFKIYRSDIDDANQFTLTSGEGFNAAFPLWRLNANSAEEIAYLRAEPGTSRVVGIDPLTAEELWSTDPVNQQWWILQSLYGSYGTFIMRENSDADWEVATINLDTREVTQLTNNDTNDCCAVWSVDGVVVTDMAALGSSPDSYSFAYLSDTEDGGRDIYSVGLDGSNPVNLTANDDREYTGILSGSFFLEHTGFDEQANPIANTFLAETLLVGYNEFEGDTPTPRLGFTWNISSRESAGDYELLFLTNGSDPDVVDPISEQQLEQMAADGLLTAACEYYTDSGRTNIKVYSEPSEFAPVVRSLTAGETIRANGVLPAIPGMWLHLTDGTWVKEADVVIAPGDCPPLPTISRYSL